MCISFIRSRIRRLCDKALCYLKDVIGTPAVHKVLYRLNPNFNSLHWAGLTDYTTLFKFAACYVFNKQSNTLGVLNFFRKKSQHYAEAYVVICRIPLEKLSLKP